MLVQYIHYSIIVGIPTLKKIQPKKYNNTLIQHTPVCSVLPLIMAQVFISYLLSTTSPVEGICGSILIMNLQWQLGYRITK